MVEFIWIKMFSLMMLLLQFRVTGLFITSYVTVKHGVDATLPCGDVRDDLDKCEELDWFIHSTSKAVYLVKRGKITEEAKSVSNRLSFGEKCSLVIKKVTVEDAGCYTCRHIDTSGSYQGSVVLLSVFTTIGQDVTFYVTVRTLDDVNLPCGHLKIDLDKCDRINWLNNSGSTAEDLVRCGNITKETKSKSNRLSVKEKCSLGIKKVTVEDAGHYTCKQFDPSGSYQDSMVNLSVVTFTRQSSYSSVIVRGGDDITLSCGDVRDDLDKCEELDWFKGSRSEGIYLVRHGEINEEARSKSNRLSFGEKCSLVLKKVTVEDVSRYTCRQFNTSGSYQDSVVLLSVVTMTEQQLDEKIMLSCSVSTWLNCLHTVKWVYEGKDVDEGNTDMKTSQSDCSANVTSSTSYLQLKPNQFFQCKVTDRYNSTVMTFNFSSSSSKSSMLGADLIKNGWWFYIVVAVGLAALLITVVVVIIWKRNKGNEPEMDAKAGQRLNSLGTQSGPESTQDMVDPDNEVSYASISYIKGKAQPRIEDNDDEGDAVTYSIVKVYSTSSAEASADPSNTYATVNKPK